MLSLWVAVDHVVSECPWDDDGIASVRGVLDGRAWLIARAGSSTRRPLVYPKHVLFAAQKVLKSRAKMISTTEEIAQVCIVMPGGAERWT